RMAKTKGNGVDPLELFDKYGVDATRLTLASLATGSDIRWNDSQIEQYRNFANKIWNASRFCLMNGENAAINVDALELSNDASIADKWIISRFSKTAIQVNKALDDYSFHEAVQLLYHFFWDDFCDWYIELVKDEITSTEDSTKRTVARTRIITILEQSLRLLHPFMPFLTEELWQKLPEVNSSLHNDAYKNADKTIMLCDFPKGDERFVNEKAESEMQAVIELIGKARNIRAEMSIKPSERISLFIAADENLRRVFSENEAQILKLSRANELKVSEKLDAPKASARIALSGGAEMAIPLEGLIDFAKETTRIEKEFVKLNAESEKLNAQLANEGFISRAPQEKIDEIRARVAEIELRNKTLTQNLEALK
ncbi:MAG: class I tRNA ligase family protein, partial [Pyrinomonadaceae bacterium]|nr:class I tRNA ligase family protein [Pyrinomonadaceae bacterium]